MIKRTDIERVTRQLKKADGVWPIKIFREFAYQPQVHGNLDKLWRSYDKNGHILKYHKNKIYLCDGHDYHFVTETVAKKWYIKFRKGTWRRALICNAIDSFNSDAYPTKLGESKVYMFFGCCLVRFDEIERIAKQRKWPNK